MKTLKELFLNEYNILMLIIVNAITIVIQGFNDIPHDWMTLAFMIDSFISVLFIIEMFVKLKHFGTQTYFKSGWNRLDFFLVLVSAPSLILLLTHVTAFDVGILFSLRLLRVFKFFRFLKFVPNIDHLILGVRRAVKASVLIFFAFFVFNLVVALFANYLFKERAPEFFGNPLISFYSIFKIFTVEGWYEIPDALAENASEIAAFFIKTFFIAILLSGGVIGLSLVNSIFVDAMVSDNTSELEGHVSRLEAKIDKLQDMISEQISKDDKKGA
ncbi:MAG: ion transporter [Flavobacteriales bacterium]